MMETSGGSRLTGRQACGVESAARKARQSQKPLLKVLGGLSENMKIRKHELMIFKIAL